MTIFSPLLERVAAALPPDISVYLVGGAVRDALLGRAVHDLDFVAPGQAFPIARQVADALGGSFYPLDAEREFGRVVITQPGGERVFLDFSVYQGSDLESDLRARDFSVNAIAVEARQPDKLFDPLGGVSDLRKKTLRACSAEAFTADPLRILRGVRLSVAFDLHILPPTRTAMRQAVQRLPYVSLERLRDELFRILEGPRPATSLRALDVLGGLPYALPELQDLKGLNQSPPHIHDVWEHTLDVIQKLEVVLSVLALQQDADLSAGLHMGLISMRLGRYREQLNDHLNTSLNPDRPPRGLLFFAALYHDIGKSQTAHVEESGRIRFFDHDLVGEKIASKRAQTLRLSNSELQRVGAIIHHHLRPILLAQSGQMPSRRAMYRFFRDTGPAGVDICLLSLADVLGTYGHTLPPEKWVQQLDVVRALLEAWWEQPAEIVSPAVLLTGGDLIGELGLKAGPQIGQLLEAIREAQVAGEVKTRQEALELALSLLQGEK